MPTIDFYTLDTASPGDRYLLTCHLVEDLYQDGARVLIHCPETERARHLDQLLWTYRQESFIPHGLVGQVDPALTPILIGADLSRQTEAAVLINLAVEVPADFARFERVCEPVDQDPAVRAAARLRFRYYRDQGFPPHHHPMSLPRDATDPW
jgi:DNA polymerase III subunit chi